MKTLYFSMIKAMLLVYYSIVLFFSSLTCHAQMSYPITDHLSNLHVQNFAEDSLGYIWIGTQHGLNRYNGSCYTSYYSQTDSMSLGNDNILSIAGDDENRIWVGTERGIYVWENGKFRHSQNIKRAPVISIVNLNKDYLIASDRKGISKINKQTLEEKCSFVRPELPYSTNIVVTTRQEIWIVENSHQVSHLHILDENLNLLQSIPMKKGIAIQHTTILHTSNEEIWLGSTQGLMRYDVQMRKELNISQKLMALLTKGRIHFMRRYKKHQLLIGIAQTGMFIYDPTTDQLSSIHAKEKLKAESYVCFTDSHDNIWLSNRSNGFVYYASQPSCYNLFDRMKGELNESITTIKIDKYQNLWIQTKTELACYHIPTQRITYKKKSVGQLGTIYIDSKDYLWHVNRYSTLERYAISEGKAILKQSLHLPNNISSISEDQMGRIWITLVDKFAVIDSIGNLSFKYAPEGVELLHLQSKLPTREMFLYTQQHGVYEYGKDQQFIPFNHIPAEPSYIYIDKENDYWIGTFDSGLYHCDKEGGIVEHYSIHNGLIESQIKSIIEDTEGNIWFSTPTKIGYLNRASGLFSYIYDHRFNQNLYAADCVCRTEDGTLYFGGGSGITVVHPESVQKKPTDTSLHFDALLLNGKNIPYNEQESIYLTHQENMLSFWYSGLNYEQGSSLTYAYQLEGYDKTWIEAGYTRRVSYSNLPSGNYVMRVKVRNPNGHWSGNELALPIYIAPSPWKSPWAIALYWIVGVSTILFCLWLTIRWQVREERLKLSERQKELNQIHIDFLTNISHEFRTPLSLIYAPLQELVSSSNLNEHDRRLASIMRRNTDRLTQLTEQILDIEKNGKHEKKLQVSQRDIGAYLHMLVENFRYAATEKNILLKIEAESTVGWFDAEKIEKIVCNLMSNAIKYTLEGEITCTLHTDGNLCHISVLDTGIGIPEDKRNGLFCRFERLGMDKKQPAIKGIGIGLNYASHLARIHKGSIAYAPNMPHGSCFTLTFPCVEDAYTKEELEASKIMPQLIKSEQNTTSKEESVLIVEDNPDVRNYLRELLADTYNVVTAQDGQEGMECMALNIPNIVLSDVIMPHKDGFQLCSEIKSHPDFGHIPVIMLTAKSDLHSNMKGLNCGADAYVNKPFDPFYLKAVIENLLTNRKRIQYVVLNLTSNSLNAPEAQQAQLNTADHQFLEQLHTLIDANLSHEGFNIQILAKEIGMSYSSLYAKIKAMTGQTPQNFLNTYRMNMAMDLLKTHQFTVSEVSYKVGISSPTNFSRSFKKHFCLSPSEV